MHITASLHAPSLASESGRRRLKLAADRLLRAAGFADVEDGGPWTFGQGHHVSLTDQVLVTSDVAAGQRADYWREMEHAVASLPPWWPQRARELLGRYADTGNLVGSAAELGFTRRRAMTVVEVFARWRTDHAPHEA